MRKTKHKPITDLQAKIALRIVEYLKDHNCGGGYHLAEEKFASLFHVSRTPVRQTLAFLEKAGVLKAVTNHGYFLTVAASKIDPAKLGIPIAAEEKLYSNVLHDKIRGIWDHQISEIDLMRRYSVLRGQATRVLWRLAKEGIIERSASIGWTFQPILDSADAVSESYRIRLLLEPAGLLEPTYKFDAKKMAKCRELHEALLKRDPHRVNGTEFFENNAMFHEALALMSGNRFVVQVMRQQNQLRRLREYKMQHVERPQESCLEHLAIMTALEANDREWAAHLLRRHLQISSKLYDEIFQLNSQEPA